MDFGRSFPIWTLENKSIYSQSNWKAQTIFALYADEGVVDPLNLVVYNIQVVNIVGYI